MSNNKVLNYYDVLLYAEDIELLIPPQWLNDQASCRQRIHWHLYCLSCLDPSKQDMTGLSFAPQTIAFWFEYLSREKYDDANLGFCPGSVTYLILHIGEHSI